MTDAARKVRTVEFAPIGIWKINQDLDIQEVNPAVEQLTGLSASELINRKLTEIVPFVPLDLFNLVRASKTSVSEKNLEAYTHADRLLPSYWEISIGPVLDGEEVTGYVLSTVEVTEREHLIQQRDDFAAALSHNLKIPLLGADRTLDVLLNGMLGALTKEQAQILQSLKESNLHLLSRLQDLIEVYRYDTGSQELLFEPVDIEETIAAACKSFAKECGLKSLVMLQLVKPKARELRLLADRRALTRLLTNLLDNAVEHSPPGAVIEVLAEPAPDEQSLLLSVKDNGPGMEAQVIERLFKRFWQGGEKGYAPVTGLGLYLCHLIARAHKGKIEAESRSHNNAGMTVKVTLPARKRQPH